MGFELRNHISHVEHQIKALQKVMEEHKKLDPTLDEIITKCWRAGFRVDVNHHIRPNCVVVESTGVAVRVFTESDIKWESVVGEAGSSRLQSTIAQHATLNDLVQYLRDTLLTNPK